MLSLNCTKNTPCENTSQNIKDYTFELIHNDTLTEFKNLSIGPSDRGGRFIYITLESEKGADEIRVTRFLPNRPQDFRFYIAPYSDGKLISQYTGAPILSKKFKLFWQKKLEWLVKHNILAISHHDWGFAINPIFTDTSYQELKKLKKGYFDEIYEHHSKEVLAQGCEVKYRYRLIFLQKNSTEAALKFLNANRKITKVYQLEQNCYYIRTMSLSAFCSLDFKYGYCKWNGG